MQPVRFCNIQGGCIVTQNQAQRKSKEILTPCSKGFLRKGHMDIFLVLECSGPRWWHCQECQALIPRLALTNSLSIFVCPWFRTVSYKALVCESSPAYRWWGAFLMVPYSTESSWSGVLTGHYCIWLWSIRMKIDLTPKSLNVFLSLVTWHVLPCVSTSLSLLHMHLLNKDGPLQKLRENVILWIVLD